MLGFADLATFLAFTLTILVTVTCVIIGIILWNKDV